MSLLGARPHRQRFLYTVKTCREVVAHDIFEAQESHMSVVYPCLDGMPVKHNLPFNAGLHAQKMMLFSLMPGSSVVLRRQLVVDIPYQAYPHLGRVVPSQHVADEVRLHLRLHHLQGAP